MPTRVTLPRGALAQLRRQDPALGALIARTGRFALELDDTASHFASLVRAIIHQQLSTKAASTIHRRLLELYPGRHPTPEELLDTTDDTLASAGVSAQKRAYLRDLCLHVERGDLPLDDISLLGDEAVIEHLTRVRGIGRWSAQMFLIFHLGRLDVFAEADLGLRRALANLQGEEALASPLAMQQARARYAPYGTVASWYLWRSLD